MRYEIRGIKEHNKAYKKIQDRLSGRIGGDTLRQAVAKALNRVVGPTKRRLTGGNPLWVRTGRLRASILVDTKRIGRKIRGEVGTSVVYARIHELGGRAGRGKKVKIPKRPFLKPSYEEVKDKIKADINRAWKAILHGKRN
jgi:phage gpG-like protein